MVRQRYHAGNPVLRKLHLNFAGRRRRSGHYLHGVRPYGERAGGISGGTSVPAPLQFADQIVQGERVPGAIVSGADRISVDVENGPSPNRRSAIRARRKYCTISTSSIASKTPAAANTGVLHFLGGHAWGSHGKVHHRPLERLCSTLVILSTPIATLLLALVSMLTTVARPLPACWGAHLPPSNGTAAHAHHGLETGLHFTECYEKY